MMMMSMAMMRTTTTSFAAFLFRELEGQRPWVLIAAILTLVQVTADLLLPFPFKLILDKLVNHKNPNIAQTIPGLPVEFYGSEGRHFVFRLRWLGKSQ